MNVIGRLPAVLASRHIPADAPALLAALLNEPGVAPVANQPTRMLAREALDLWGLRLRTADITGKSLYGAAVLVDELRKLPGDTEIDQFGLIGDHMAGVVLFDGRDDQFIGAIVVER
jgi:hypothetical protein